MTNDNINNEKAKTIGASLLCIFARLGIFARCFIIASVVAIIFSVTMLILRPSVGLIVLGALTILLSGISAFNTDKFRITDCENADKSPKLTKIGVIILITTLILGICSLACGIVMLLDTEDLVYTYDFAKEENTFAPGADKLCTVKVTPDTAGMYTVTIKGATLDGITNGRGNKIYPIANTDSDETYTVFLVINTDYLFQIHSIGDAFSIKLEKSN